MSMHNIYTQYLMYVQLHVCPKNWMYIPSTEEIGNLCAFLKLKCMVQHYSTLSLAHVAINFVQVMRNYLTAIWNDPLHYMVCLCVCMRACVYVCVCILVCAYLSVL